MNTADIGAMDPGMPIGPLGAHDIRTFSSRSHLSLERTPAIALVFYGWTLFVILNCILTPNPFAANHSGKAGLDGAIISETWSISPAWFLIVVSILVVFFTAKGFPRDIILYLAIFLQFLSGCITEDYFEKPQTYLFDALMYALCAALAYRDTRTAFR
jgi:hypothetical protein